MYREFKILNSANHKNITSLLTVYSPGVAITDFAQFKEIYFVLPYVETTLSKLIANSYATVSFDQKTFIVYQLLCGLDYLHKNNIYYRNLIPHNISVDKGFNVKIMSFSFASLICEELEPFALLDAYKAPEILCRKTLYDCKVDLWSLGCIFIEIFTGKRIVHRFSTQLTAGHWFIVIKMLGIQPGDSFFQDMSRCSYSKINKQNESAAWDEILPTTCFMEAFQNSEECVKNAKLAQNLLSKMLQICPDLRCTAEDAMKHPFLSKWYDSADLNAGGQTTFYKPDVDKISDPLKLKKLLYEEVKTYMEENDVLRIQSAKLNIANEQTDQNNLQIIDDQRLINTAYNWFFVGMSRIKAHVLLANVSEEGIFLVRTNEEEYPNGCILSIRLCNCVRHYRLKDENGRYIFNGAEFGKLNKLFKYSQISCGDSFQMNPIYIKPGDMEMADETLKQIDTQLFDTSDDYENMISMRSFKEFSVETYLKYPSKLVFAIPAYSIFYICNENMNPVKIEYNGFRYFADEKKVKQSAIKFDPNNDHVFLLNETITQNLSLNEYFLFDLVFKEDLTKFKNPYGRIRFGSEIEQDCNKWMKRINIQIKKINDAKSVPKPSKGTNSIHEKMSKLTVYFKTYSFDDLNAETDYIHYYNKVCSINEQKFEALNKIDPMNRFNSKKMSRVYPHYTRIESDNYDPLPCWNAGCQMVALNYQDDGKEMLLNYGRFLANGNCGYVPKPYLITRKVLLSDRNARPKLLTISIIGGRNLKRLFSHSSGICSPMIEVWIAGHERDKQYQKTKAVRLNGLNPVWKDGQFNFPIYYPELDFLCFRVIDADYIGFINKNYFVDPSKNQSIGQAAFSLNCLRLGYRSIPLLNNYNQPLEMSSLLVNVINLPYKQNRH
ncbi:1-phosphatidylinositol 4,5-bisphosphate phosphodiesterase gamma-1 [Aphelenchoides bicaudatus]|nr:1-phosphatidylinositol 4,5-bisphosphate phosphodiesterase gamma-1 [Aphelenchoides bicaudatus]